MILKNLTHDHPQSTFRTILFLHFRYVHRIVNYYSVLTQTVPRIISSNISLTSEHPHYFHHFFYLENFNADVAIMMEMWDIVTSNHDGRGLASFVENINYFIVSFHKKLILHLFNR